MTENSKYFVKLRYPTLRPAPSLKVKHSSEQISLTSLNMPGIHRSVPSLRKSTIYND